MVAKIGIICVFFIVMAVVAVYSRRRSDSAGEFLLAGRSVGPWLSAFSYGAAYFSAVIMVGYAGRNGWNFGLPSTWIGIGNTVIGSLLAWLVLAKRTRLMTRHLEASTLPGFFEKRYQSPNLKVVSAFIIFIFLVPYSASVYQGLSYLFESSLGIRFEYCMIAMAVITAVYLFIGGYFATALSNLIQGIIMLAAIVFVMIWVIASPQVGGIAEGISRLGAIDSKLVWPFGPDDTGGFWPLMSLVFLTSFGAWGLPQVLHKFYAIKDEYAIKVGTIISTVFALIIAGGAYFIGGLSRLFMEQVPVDAVTGAANADLIVPTMLSLAKLPDILMGIFLVAVLSASASTLSSLVLVSSSAITMDLLKGRFVPNMKKSTELVYVRLFCGAFIIISYIIATNRQTAIQTLMTFSWGVVSGSFLAPFMLGLYWKRMTKWGAWAGVLSGVGVSLILTTLFKMGPAQSPVIGTVAMCVSMVLSVIVSMFTPQMPHEHIENVFECFKKKKA